MYQKKICVREIQIFCINDGLLAIDMVIFFSYFEIIVDTIYIYTYIHINNEKLLDTQLQMLREIVCDIKKQDVNLTINKGISIEI